MYLKDMENHLGYQLNFIKGILEKAESKHPTIASFIAGCFSSLYNSCFKKLDSISEWCQKRNLSHESLDAICIQMMEECGNCSPVNTWIDLLCADMIPSLDASLAYRLWDEIHGDSSPDFIVMVAGQAHIFNLSELADSLFTKGRSVSVWKSSSSIHPDQLENMLQESLSKTSIEICSLQ